MVDLRQTENLFITLSGDGAADLICLGARIREKFSTISEMRMEFISKTTGFEPKSILGKRITIETLQDFKFSAIVVSVEDVGLLGGDDVYAAELRPWLWMTTLGEDNRVYQNKSTIEIVTDVFNRMGFTDVASKAGKTYQPREYCVQYGESNFDFVSRLLEEDGLYYYFDHSGAVEKLILADSETANPDQGEIAFTKSNIVDKVRADLDTIYEWSVVGKVVSGKVTLWDYDFEKPTSNLIVTSAKPSGNHGNNQIERYNSGGHYKVYETGEGLYARNVAEAHAAHYNRATGLCNIATLRCGVKFKLAHPDRPSAEGTYRVIAATHYIRFDDGSSGTEIRRVARAGELIKYPEQMALYETEFEVMPDAVPYKPLRKTPWPEVPSLLTAVVTGPRGDEIHTDEYGRIRIQFPWDRLGYKNETSSCWVRSVMPWTGKNYGFIAVPRIGMEVIIQFERGNIDRPICTGMVYDGVNKPPYALPAAMDTVALRTNSTKGGGGYHELSMKDEKGKEKIFFQSEKDYEQKIKNNAIITIGMEKMDKGDLTQTVYRHMTETIKTGDVTQTIETGSRITTIKTDDTTTVTGASTTTITKDTSTTITEGNMTTTVSKGNVATTVSKGNVTTTIDKGNKTVTVSKGDISVKADAGAITIEAQKSITLKVGGNSIVIDTTGIQVKGASVGITAQGQAKLEGADVTASSSGIMTIQGSMVKIN